MNSSLFAAIAGILSSSSDFLLNPPGVGLRQGRSRRSKTPSNLKRHIHGWRRPARALDEKRVLFAMQNAAKPGFNDKFINPRHKRP
jgi:hypothetical protein